MDKNQKAIREKLGHFALKEEPTIWLDTGIPDLNRVLGHKDFGIAYGKMVEISGWESQGKTAILMALAALAQQDDAFVIWGDVENSFEPDWALTRGFLPCPKCKADESTREQCGTCDGSGLDYSKLMVIKPYVGEFQVKGKDGKVRKETRLTNAQELCAEIEEAIKMPKKQKKCFVVLDSIAALLTAGEADAGISGQNMRTSMDLPLFMGKLLRRWVGLAQVHHASINLVNQLREGPAKFGDPSYTPGGNAPRFYSHVRVRAYRVSGSRIIDKGKLIGIKGVLKNVKNKAGGEEYSEVGYRLIFKGALEFVPAKEVKKKEGE